MESMKSQRPAAVLALSWPRRVVGYSLLNTISAASESAPVICAQDMGCALSGKIREPRCTSRRGDCSNRTPCARLRAATRTGDPFSPRERLHRLRTGRALLCGAWVRADRGPVSAECPLRLSPLGSRWEGASTRRDVSCFRQQESLPGPTSTIGAPAEHLDLATVIKVSQAV